MEQMSEKDFFTTVSGIGITIVNLADAYKKLYRGHNISFNEACGWVVGMALNASSAHDNSADILQAAAMLKTYAQLSKTAQAVKYMVQ